MPDQVKDFAYYAEKAEAAITKAEQHDDQAFNPNLRATALMAAEIFAHLAVAAPQHSDNPAQCYHFDEDGNHVEGCPPMNFNDGTR